MQLNLNFNLPLAQGTFKGVNWRSLTPIGQAQSEMLEKMLRNHNQNRQKFGLGPTGIEAMIRAKYDLTLYQWCRHKFKRLDYYNSKGKYLNNFEVL